MFRILFYNALVPIDDLQLRVQFDSDWILSMKCRCASFSISNILCVYVTFIGDRDTELKFAEDINQRAAQLLEHYGTHTKRYDGKIL